jgi:predicted HAD superfamily Cof-like phosphohydrolase
MKETAMKEEIAQVLEFHQAFGLGSAGSPTADLPPDLIELRARLLQEELDEYRQAAASRDLEAVADALSDLLYVLLGTYLTHGLQEVAGELFAAVHKSNMSKLDASGKPVHREDGKVLKSDRFAPPDLGAILARAAHGPPGSGDRQGTEA